MIIYTEDAVVGSDISKMTLGLTRHLKGAGISTGEFCDSVNRLVQGIVMTTTENRQPVELPR